ncbi:hypothetical protein [Aeromonas dhakensis]|uniref:hypothetical protein n=1 Tax=Aeromonas dhakensis TaxID=196024 RepID=UPI002378EF50|nr:hypothetical protein [Aeromonas dhakensis]MDD9210808.1 hypothetical protein [Aeromonas dhakensis]
MSIKILRIYELQLVNYLKGEPFFADEEKIQYGVQFVTKSNVIVNFHYSDRAPSVVKVTIQRDTANPEHAQFIRHFAEGLQVAPHAFAGSLESLDW